MKIQFRSVTDADSAAMAELLTILGYPQSAQFVLEKIKLYLDDRSRIFVAVDANQVVGFISLHVLPLMHAEGNLGKFTILVVNPEYARKGIGTSLVRLAENFAAEKGAAMVELVTNNDRIGAHCFYEKLGFRKTAQFRFIKSLLAK